MTTTPHDIDSLEGTRLGQHLEELKARLTSEYATGGELTDTEVNRLFDAAREHFGGAAVRLFLPILIERRVRAAIRRQRETATPHQVRDAP